MTELLDLEVEHHVFGHELARLDGRDYWVCPKAMYSDGFGYDDRCENGYVVYLGSKADRHGHPVGRYSQDVHAAWAIVDRMADLGWKFKCFNWEDDKGWCAEFYRRELGRGTSMYWRRCDAGLHGESLPQAICLAALDAIRAMTKEERHAQNPV